MLKYVFWELFGYSTFCWNSFCFFYSFFAYNEWNTNTSCIFIIFAATFCNNLFQTDGVLDFYTHNNTYRYRGITTRERPWNSDFNLKTKKGPTVLVSNIRDIVFSRCSEIMQTRYFTIFTVYATIFEQFMAAFVSSDYIGEKDHFTLGLLKRSDS